MPPWLACRCTCKMRAWYYSMIPGKAATPISLLQQIDSNPSPGEVIFGASRATIAARLALEKPLRAQEWKVKRGMLRRNRRWKVTCLVLASAGQAGAEIGCRALVLSPFLSKNQGGNSDCSIPRFLFYRTSSVQACIACTSLSKPSWNTSASIVSGIRKRITL
jgi:hypothetical protein